MVPTVDLSVSLGNYLVSHREIELVIGWLVS